MSDKEPKTSNQNIPNLEELIEEFGDDFPEKVLDDDEVTELLAGIGVRELPGLEGVAWDFARAATNTLRDLFEEDVAHIDTYKCMGGELSEQPISQQGVYITLSSPSRPEKFMLSFTKSYLQTLAQLARELEHDVHENDLFNPAMLDAALGFMKHLTPDFETLFAYFGLDKIEMESISAEYDDVLKLFSDEPAWSLGFDMNLCSSVILMAITFPEKFIDEAPYDLTDVDDE